MQIQTARTQEAVHVFKMLVVIVDAQMLEHLNLRNFVVTFVFPNVAIVAQLKRYFVGYAKSFKFISCKIKLGLAKRYAVRMYAIVYNGVGH